MNEANIPQAPPPKKPRAPRRVADGTRLHTFEVSARAMRTIRLTKANRDFKTNWQALDYIIDLAAAKKE